MLLLFERPDQAYITKKRELKLKKTELARIRAQDIEF